MRDVAAPGGDGINSCEVSGKNPDSDEYVCQGEPNFCLISLVDKPYPGYAYWVGTSFATPLVSGQAALLREAGVPPAGVGGVINLPPSLR